MSEGRKVAFRKVVIICTSGLAVSIFLSLLLARLFPQGGALLQIVPQILLVGVAVPAIIRFMNMPR